MENFHSYLKAFVIKNKTYLGFLILSVVVIGGIYLSGGEDNFTSFVGNKEDSNPTSKIGSVPNQVATANQIIATTFIYADVSGSVYKPGVYKLSKGSLVADALSSAGGVKTGASEQWIARNIHLARELTNNEKIYVPFEWEISIADSTKFAEYLSSISDYDFDSIKEVLGYKNNDNEKICISGTSPGIPNGSGINVEEQAEGNNNNPGGTNSNNLMNINKVSLQDLDSLPGIGPAYAQRILDSRPYKNFDELSDKSSVPNSALNKIKDLISY